MENLPMSLELDNQFKRQYQILNLLHTTQSDQLTMDELSDKLGKSKPTLRKDIEAINQALENNYVSLHIDPKGTLTISYKKAITIDSMITLLAKETITYQTMTLLLHSISYTTDELAAVLMVSRSTIFKTIRHMNIILKDYNLTITTGPLSFIGKEEDIRFCFFAYYSAFGDSTIIDTDSEVDAKSLIDEGHKRDLAFLHFSHFRVALWLSIANARWKCGKFCNLNRKTKALINRNKGFIAVRELLQDYYVSRSKESSSLNETMWLYLISLHCISYTKQTNLDDGRYYTFRRNEVPSVLETVQRFLRNVFPASMLNDPSLEKMEAYLLNTRLLSKMSNSYELTSPVLVTQMKKRHPDLYTLWIEKLTDLKANPLFGFVHLEHLAATLTTFHASMLMAHSYKPLRILFAIQGSPAMDDYILQEIKALFTQQSTIEFRIEFAVTKETILDSQADLVVCNYDLHLIDEESCKIHRVSNIPTLTDWRMVMDTISYLALPDSTDKDIFYES